MRAARILSSVAIAVMAGGCAVGGLTEVPVETPIKPKIDASPFARVYVAGFVAGGSEDVDTNLETVRLLRSQLKNKANMRVIEADVLPLMELARPVQDGAAPATPAEVRNATSGKTSVRMRPVNLPDAPAAGNASRHPHLCIARGLRP